MEIIKIVRRERNLLEILMIIWEDSVRHAVSGLGVTEVDVNEQNPQAYCFYQKQGFKKYSRSELDGQGNPFPVLHLRYISAKDG